MTELSKSRGGLEYYPCRYGKSRLGFRGPRRMLKGPYLACLGGTETYGRFVPEPYPTLIEAGLNVPVANFGVINAGIDLFRNDPDVLALVQEARLVVCQVMGAANMSNRYYSVHPRRNDRFLKASDKLLDLYPEVDFTEFNFTRHLLQALIDRGPERFDQVIQELQTAWVARMKSLVGGFLGGTILVWMSDKPVPEHVSYESNQQLGPDPLFVTKAMIDELRPRLLGFVEVSDPPRPHRADGMIFSDFEEIAARACVGPDAHKRLSMHLLEKLRPALEVSL